MLPTLDCRTPPFQPVRPRVLETAKKASLLLGSFQPQDDRDKVSQSPCLTKFASRSRICSRTRRNTARRASLSP
jgi:hypothetical protein